MSTPEPKSEGHMAIHSDSLSLDKFEPIKKLGTGTSADVSLVRPKDQTGKDSHNVYALKRIHKAQTITLKQREHVSNEVMCHRSASGHPFVASIIGTFSDADDLYILTEYCPGKELFYYLQHARSFNLSTSRIYAAEMVLVLEYLHTVHGIVYRDVKPENMVLRADGHVGIIDFGFAKQIFDRETKTLCGTPEYVAPEILKNEGHGMAADWWSLGIMIYNFLTGDVPFSSPDPMTTYREIIEGDLKFPSCFDADARDIVIRLCQKDPRNRLGYGKGGPEMVKQHPFFKSIDWSALYDKKVDSPIKPRLTDPLANPDGGFPTDSKSQAQYSPSMKEYEDFFSQFSGKSGSDAVGQNARR